MRLSGCRALVTGASSGIGERIAARLSTAGCQVVVSARDSDALRQVAAATGAEVVPADLSRPEDLRRLAATCTGPSTPDLVVHNAGVGYSAAIGDSTDEDTERILAVNLHAPIALTRMVAPEMLRRGSGRLVFVTSIAGELGVEKESVYAASKAGLAVFADSLHSELSGTGVGVTTVVPGVVDTPFFRRRGVPYQRRFPRPIRADRVARALVRAVERDRARIVVPAWMRLPIAVRAVTPEIYARLA